VRISREALWSAATWRRFFTEITDNAERVCRPQIAQIFTDSDFLNQEIKKSGNQEIRKSGNGGGGSCVPAFLIKLSAPICVNPWLKISEYPCNPWWPLRLSCPSGWNPASAVKNSRLDICTAGMAKSSPQMRTADAHKCPPQKSIL
jgi:hypothetical protein